MRFGIGQDSRLEWHKSASHSQRLQSHVVSQCPHIIPKKTLVPTVDCESPLLREKESLLPCYTRHHHTLLHTLLGSQLCFSEGLTRGSTQHKAMRISLSQVLRSEIQVGTAGLLTRVHRALGQESASTSLLGAGCTQFLGGTIYPAVPSGPIFMPGQTLLEFGLAHFLLCHQLKRTCF